MNSLPLFVERSDGIWLTGLGRSYTQQEFCGRVLSLADALPERTHIILLAEKRGDFLACFCAALLRGQTVLLPVNATDGAIADLSANYPDSYAVADLARPLPVDCFALPELANDSLTHTDCQIGDLPLVPANQIAAVLQTSGSTGEPQSHSKTWGQLVSGARRLAQRLALSSADCVVATVPAQHMYGLETAVLLPLQSGAALYDGQPLYPGDVAAALENAVGYPFLVTTPLHLSACVREDMEWPSVKKVVCSTARLDPLVAQQSAKLLRAEVTELYGSTETGAVATRQATKNELWLCLDGLELQDDGGNDGNYQLVDTVTKAAVPIADNIEIKDREHFRLLGRPADMLKIAGKRMSLADLNIRLNRIAGVNDGIILVADQDSEVRRLIALVVIGDGQEPQIRDELAQQIDPVFLPRKIYYVDRLPRSASGKLPHHALKALLQNLGDH